MNRLRAGLIVLRLVPVLVLLLTVNDPHGAARGSASTTIRVGILLEQESVTLKVEGGARIVDVATGAGPFLPAGTYEARPGLEGVVLRGRRLGPVVRVRPQAGFLRVESRGYRGVVELRRTVSGRLTVINELDLEEYLYGVVKREVDPRWPAEALKAQAVAARTLAFYSLGRFAAEGYDLRATTESQVYDGVEAEDPRTTTAVDGTRSMVVTFEDRPIFAAYHADSGGATESSEYVWGGMIPYLRGVPDPYGDDSPVREWLARIDLPTLETRLQRAGRPVRRITGLSVVATSPSGRAMTVRITGGHGTLDMRGLDLRPVVGATLLRSTLFTVRQVEGETPSLEFEGRGSGHGVGMSQWGARGQALAGRTYVDILQFYYQGVKVEAR